LRRREKTFPAINRTPAFQPVGRRYTDEAIPNPLPLITDLKISSFEYEAEMTASKPFRSLELQNSMLRMGD
jgi:hypothetical protein